MSAIDPSPANPKTSREPESSKNFENSLKSLIPHETEDFYEFGPSSVVV
jgi:hypothetical protein